MHNPSCTPSAFRSAPGRSLRARSRRTRFAAPAAAGVLAALLLAPALLPGGLGAQTLEGRVVRAGTGAPLAGATVMGADSATGAVQQTVTDELGRFTLTFGAGAVVAVAAVAPDFDPSAPARFRLDGALTGVVLVLTPTGEEPRSLLDLLQEPDDPDDPPPAQERREYDGPMVITGRVRERESARPVGQAQVTFVLGDSVLTATAVTDGTGTFRLEPPFREGMVTVAVSALGYQTPEPRRVILQGEPVFLSLTMQAQPLDLPTLEVTVSRREPRLERFGVLDRAARGFGDVIMGEQIERLRITAGQTSRMLLQAPGVFMTPSQSEPMFRRAQGMNMGQGCSLPDIWLDGTLVRPGVSSTARFDEVVPPPEMIAAIETFPNPRTAPVQFRTNSSGCGIILVWTR
ncbi:MAG: carboxypeptidase-like regulatory domain-containing protein [Longimicrobiales bacterium]|nr:carboxypeptidase-like regulatory domain-containing protein [Longimicrobiales bacterium]